MCGFREQSLSSAIIVPATSSVPLILAFGAPIGVQNVGSPASLKRFGSFMAGLFPGYSTLRPTGPQVGIQVNLTPEGAYRILRVPGAELVNQVVSIEDVAPAALVALPEQLAAIATWPDRFQLVEETLTSLAAEGADFESPTAWVLSRIVSSGGRVRISELVSESGWSHRYLTSLFRRQVGLPPKALATVVRFERAAATLARQRLGLARTAYECGYADQSHLIREFRRFAGYAPASAG